MGVEGFDISPEPTERKTNDDGSIVREIWSLPTDEMFLDSFLRDIFEHHWKGLRFGPLIEGAAYEWKCPTAPTKIGLMDGYLTIHFGHGGHFHLCIGENKGSDKFPVSVELRAHRRPSKAQIFRSYGRDGKPVSWGFEMWNGKDEPMISIFFANPFIEDDDTLADEPKWERLAMWRDISSKWLGREAEVIDQEGQGFRATKR
ncbi:MAG: hypothetical protein ACK5KM_14150 [Hyphomicrobiaceae bacterium]